ncbi:hypothetical protein KP509_1Z260600 [Ceratopteris richardii]|nr:hypothetical protein KP509_1Z260600 [Ceratopteris richardii]
MCKSGWNVMKSLASLEDHVCSHKRFLTRFIIFSMIDLFFLFAGGFAESSSPYAISGIPTEVEIIQKFHVPADIPVLLNEEDVLTRSVEEDVLPPLPMEEDIDIEEMEISRERLELEGEVEAVEKSKMVSVEDVNVTGDLRVVGQEMTIEAEGMKVCIEDHIVEAAVEVEAEHRGIEVEAEQRGVEAETEQHRIEEISIEQVQEVPRREVEISERPVAEPEKDVLGAILGVKMAEPSVKPTARVSEKRKRKQRLIYDEVAAIPSLDMKRQLGSSSNLIRFRRKAPCNKYQIWLAEGGDDIGRKFLEPSLPGMCPELKRLSSFIVNVEPPEEAEAVPETVRPTAKRIATEVEPSEEVEAVLETVRPTAKRLSMEVVEDIELDVEEIFEGDELVELEADTTVRHAIKQTEIVTSPRVSPQPPEESYSEVQVEATSSVKRRLEFEKGLLPGQEQAIEVGIEAEQVETLQPPLFPAQVGAVPVAGEVKTVPRKAKKPFREEFLESARPSEVSPAEEVLEEEMVTEQPEIPPSEGLGFLAESRGAGLIFFLLVCFGSLL